MKTKKVILYDKFMEILNPGDWVDVQGRDVQQLYEKEDGQLYFKPYGKEDKVISYFRQDLIKVTKDNSEFLGEKRKQINSGC